MYEKARQLRSQGWSLQKIADELGYSKSWASKYTKAVQLPEFKRKELAKRGGLFNGNEKDSKSQTRIEIGEANWVEHEKARRLRKRKRWEEKHPNYVRNRKQEIKRKLVKYKGGKCQKCGYDRCIAALDFHHRDPSIKEFSLSRSQKSFAKQKIEADKCDLLCKICHAELHNPNQMTQ